MYKETLDNMECVGTFDGEKFDFEMPYLYTSIFELDRLDVFTLKKQYKYNGLFSEKTITIDPDEKLVLEDFCKYNLTNVSVSRLEEPGKIFTVYNDHKVDKVGKIRIDRIFEES